MPESVAPPSTALSAVAAASSEEAADSALDDDATRPMTPPEAPQPIKPLNAPTVDTSTERRPSLTPAVTPIAHSTGRLAVYFQRHIPWSERLYLEARLQQEAAESQRRRKEAEEQERVRASQHTVVLSAGSKSVYDRLHEDAMAQRL